MQFVKFHKHLQAPYTIFADFESNLRGLQKANEDNVDNKPYADIYKDIKLLWCMQYCVIKL